MSDERLAALEQRLQRLEDELAITRLLASYGPLVDAGDADGVAELWCEDGDYDVEGLHMEGRDQIRAMVRSRTHQGFISGGSLHFLALPHVEVHGDAARATCESMLVLRREGRYSIHRGTANRFELRRDPGGWRITSRVSRVLDGSDTARGLLRLSRLPSESWRNDPHD